jgi:hypothetical protein
MKKRCIAWGGFALAVSVAAGSFLYLKKTEAVLKAALEPVDLSAPDLFPEETLLFAAFHRVNDSYAKLEEWWRRFEPTAMHHALRGLVERSRREGPSDLRSLLDLLESEMDKAQKRFGYRPATRDFFDVYGKYAAVGLLPPRDGKRPGLLAVIQLPGGSATALLQSQLKQSDLRCLGEVQGFPVFVEERKGPGTFYYGVGAGFLFLADDPANLEGSLRRLAGARERGLEPKAGDAPAGAPPGTLSSDPVFKRGVAGPWKEIRLAIYLKRDLAFGSWREELKLLDEYVQSAFALLPGDLAAAFSAVETGTAGTLVLRSSVREERKKPWTEVLPAGLAYLDQVVTLEPEELKKAYEPALNELREKKLWKEIQELLGSPERMGTLAREALPPQVRPGEEILKRIPNDARFLAAAGQGVLESAWLMPPPSVVQAVKAYPTTGGSLLQYAFAFEVDPFSSFLVAGALDLASSRAQGWVLRTEERGLLSWRLDVEKLVALLEKDAETERMKEALGSLKLNPPSVILSEGRIFFVLGSELAGEITALLTGASKASLADDALFQEASASVKKGYVTINYRRQAVLDEAFWSVLQNAVDLPMSRGDVPAAAKETIRALMTALRQAVGWERSVRAEITAAYPSLEEPSATVTLMDAAAEKALPGIALPPAPLRALGLLPGKTYWLNMTRVEPGVAYDAFLDAFSEALPGGKSALEQRRKELGLTGQILADLERDLVRNVRGEVGIAVTLPELAGDARQVRSPGDFFQRAPGVILFLECKDAKAALKTAGGLFALLQDSSRSAPPGVLPWKDIKALSGLINGHSALALEAPLSLGAQPLGGDGPKLTLCLLERDGFLILASSEALLAFEANVAAGSDQTLAWRLERGLSREAIPESLSQLQLFSGDGVIDQLRLFLDPLVPLAASWTLRGYRGRPPGERVLAHLGGWTRVLELAEDLFRSGAWKVTYTTREGDRQHTRSARRLESKT